MRFSAGIPLLCVRLLQMLLGIICQTTPAAYVVSRDAIKPALYLIVNSSTVRKQNHLPVHQTTLTFRHRLG